MVRNILVIFTAFLILPACTLFTKKEPLIRVEKQIIEVPVYSCPAPRDISRPALAIDSLTPADKTNPGKVGQAYKATVKTLQGYAAELETELNAYKKPQEVTLPKEQ